MSDSSDVDDFIAQQAAMAAAKYGGIVVKAPLLNEDKKKFDSADYYQKQEQVMKAAGMGAEGEEDEKEMETG